MALQKGINSYVTVIEADAYFSDRLDVSAWVSADATQKAQALVTATMLLDDQIWVGTAVSESQPLAFPRNGEYFDPRLGTTQYMDVVPARILRATMEEAYHLLNNDGVLDDTGSVATMNVAGISLSTIKAANKIPGEVQRIIKPLLENAGSNSWWRAN